jgi:ketosteroid isomerase-like protein
MTTLKQTVSSPSDKQQSDEEQIHAVIDAWGESSAAGDLTAQLNLMTHDVIFLTPGNATSSP